MLLLGTALLVGCADDPVSTDDPKNPGDSTDTTGVRWTLPKAGSVFQFSTQNQDRDRAPQGAPQMQTDSLVRTDLAFAGKSGVYAFVTQGDTTYVKHEANGDMSVYLHQDDRSLRGMEPRWITVPFGSRSTATDTLANIRNYYPEGSPVDVPMLLTGRFESRPGGEFTLGGRTYTTNSMRWTITRREGSILYRIYMDWDVAPALGYPTRIDFLNEGWSSFGIEIPGGGYVRTLTGMSLK